MFHVHASLTPIATYSALYKDLYDHLIYVLSKDQLRDILIELQNDLPEYQTNIDSLGAGSADPGSDGSVRYILVVEKEIIYNRLMQSKLHQINNCLIVCGYGQADERTRGFLEEKIDLCIYGLTDPDPWGISIVKTFAKGSENLSLGQNIDSGNSRIERL